MDDARTNMHEWNRMDIEDNIYETLNDLNLDLSKHEFHDHSGKLLSLAGV